MMSKVHEALKKAQQETFSAQRHEEPLALGDFDSKKALRTDVVTELAEGRAKGASVPASNSKNSLQFETLVAQCARPQWMLDPEFILFTESKDSSAGAEQFRKLRTRLDKIRESKPLKKLQITSAISGEGKTFVASNLAQAISRQQDRRVLLVDADLRRSMLHLPLRAPMSPGLSDYLLGRAKETDVVQHGNGGGLFFVPGGTQVNDPSELLSSIGLKTFFDRMASLFDWVIVDSPPCLALADAQAISAVCDGILMVVRAQFTPMAAVHRASQELKECNIVGTVLNDLRYYTDGHRSISI